jgi:hypothetical protein
MPMLDTLLYDLPFYTVSFVALYAAVKAAQFLYQTNASALWNLPGPKRSWRIKGTSADFRNSQVRLSLTHHPGRQYRKN